MGNTVLRTNRIHALRIAPRCPRSIAIALLAISLICARPRPAQAQVQAAAAVISAMVSAYELYTDLTSPSLATQLRDVVNQVTTYMNTQRDLGWVTTARTAVLDFQALVANYSGDPTSLNLYSTIYNLLSSDIDAMYTYLGPESGSHDFLSMYQTAPTLNLLGSTWIGLLNYKKYLYPGYPAFWGEYHSRLSEVMMTDYYWAGYSGIICYPGSNPWYGNYDLAHAPTVTTWWGYTFPLASNGGTPYYDKELFKSRKTLGSYPWVLNPSDCPPGGNACGFFVYCYLDVGQCGCNANHGSYDAALTSSCLPVARQNAIPVFEQDATVSLIHTSMGALLWAGGGNYPGDYVNTSWPQFPTTAFLDPVVKESMCSMTDGKAYPMHGYYGY